MQRVDLQFYAFFMTTLCGIALGFLFDLLRALRGYYRPNRWVGGLGDLLFWGAATLALAGGLFVGNWGEFRFYVLVGLLIGLGFYSWLASPMVVALARALLGLLTWLLDLLWGLVLRLVWSPVLALAALLLGTGRILWRWAQAFLGGAWRALEGLGSWLVRPLTRPYRWLRLHYLLTKRKAKRSLRRMLFGPRRPRHK